MLYSVYCVTYCILMWNSLLLKKYPAHLKKQQLHNSICHQLLHKSRPQTIILQQNYFVQYSFQFTNAEDQRVMGWCPHDITTRVVTEKAWQVKASRNIYIVIGLATQLEFFLLDTKQALCQLTFHDHTYIVNATNFTTISCTLTVRYCACCSCRWSAAAVEQVRMAN